MRLVDVSKAARCPDDLNPMADRDEDRRLQEAEPAQALNALNKAGVAAHLPQSLSNEEIDKRWTLELARQTQF